MEHLGLSPQQLLNRPRPLAFIDLVYNGDTFGNLLALLRDEAGPELWPGLRERLRWVCILEHDNPTSPTWAPAESAWTTQVPGDAVRCVPISWELWRYLADDQPKTTVSHVARRWGSPAAALPPRWENRLSAAGLARSLFRLGERWRPQLAAELGQPPAPEPWLHALIGELRAS
jgi:hypothetical protein